MSVYSISERKESGKTTIVERKVDASRSTALRRLNVRCCSHFGRKVRQCMAALCSPALRRGAARAIFALQIVRQQFGSSIVCGVTTLSGRLCSTVRRSDAVQPSSAPLRSGPTPFGHVRGGSDDVPGRFLLY